MRRIFSRTSISGFTLIEILVALLIVALAFTAIIKATSLNSRQESYLHDKIVAQWTGLNIIWQFQIGILNVPTNLTEQNGSSDLMNTTWYWTVNFSDTEDGSAIRLQITVKNNEDKPPITQLTGYLKKP